MKIIFAIHIYHHCNSLYHLLIDVSIAVLISIYFIIQNNFKAEYKITEKKNSMKRRYTLSS